MYRVFWAVIAAMMLGCVPSAYAQYKNRSVTNITYGSYAETNGDDRVNGTMLSIAYNRFITDEWAWFLGFGSGSATGNHEMENGSQVTLKSSRSSFSGGMKWYYYPENIEWLVPYLGAGVSIQTYHYDFDYSGSDIGSTSGTGYGPLFMFGARMDIARHFLIIPGYQYEQIHIESEAGKRVVLTSAGFLLALVVRF